MHKCDVCIQQAEHFYINKREYTNRTKIPMDWAYVLRCHSHQMDVWPNLGWVEITREEYTVAEIMET